MIRLARRGKKNKAFFRVVVSEKARDMFGNATEIVGFYNPTSTMKDIKLDADRITYWISKGAQLSPTVRNLLIDQGVIGGVKVKKKLSKKKKESK